MRQADKRGEGILVYALIILPAVALGVLGMILGGVSPALWGQQAAAWLVFTLIALPLRRAVGRVPAAVWSVLLLAVLAASLFGMEAGGAKRWVKLAVFHVNAANLILPALLIALDRMKRPYPAWIAAAAVLCVQPDFSQLAALCAAAVPVLRWDKKERLWGMGSVLVLAILVVTCMNRPTAIEPVAYCEGILDMLGETSWLLKTAGWMALVIIPAFFLHRYSRRKDRHLLSLSIYYAVMLLFVFSGEYSVPFMGFGLSPIAGYFLTYICGAGHKA